jgi:hypothetical protein
MEQAMATERVGNVVLCALSLGEAHLTAGRLDEVYTLAKHDLALACEHQERGNQAYALRLPSDIAARRIPGALLT